MSEQPPPAEATPADLSAVAAQARELAGQLPGGLTRLAVTTNGIEIAMEWAAPSTAAPAPAQAPGPTPAAAPAAAPSVIPAAPEPQVEDGVAITAPLVGTFYTAKSPDAPVYVEMGDRIEVGQVVGIVEAMKLLNEVRSEIAGTIIEIAVSNGEAVEFDQVLFRVEA